MRAASSRPGHISDYPTISNPYGVKGLGDPLQGLGALLLLVAVIGSPWSLALRFRRAEREERQQIKWLALAGATAAVTLVIALLLYDVSEAAANVSILLSVLALPVATGIAVLRYRLYDIDVVINRALVYAALTATLAATYLGSVLLLQLALESLTAGSNLAVAASTLAVAALFRPARARIQQAVDHRFFRRRYDAARTLETFSARLRDEVSLDALERRAARRRHRDGAARRTSRSGCARPPREAPRDLLFTLTVSIALARVVLAIADPRSSSSATDPMVPGGACRSPSSRAP